jgi:ferredoxin
VSEPLSTPRTASAADTTRHVVSVDRMRCQGHARCWQILPVVFTLDEEGYSDIGLDRPVPPGLEEQARRAVESCPELALRIEPMPDLG